VKKPKKPLKRSWIKKKPKKAKTSWRSGKIRLDARGMEDLRLAAYQRSGGRCESVKQGKRCGKPFHYLTFELHHLQHRSLGGSDVLQNVACLDAKCHSDHHLKNMKIVPYWSLYAISDH
jgi:5-methylcytosine-specific restriction endonuclease McrA